MFWLDCWSGLGRRFVGPWVGSEPRSCHRTNELHMQVEMIWKTHTFACPLNAEEALRRVADLLSKEGVNYAVSNLAIASTATPFVVFGIQRRLYSHHNRAALNPFAFVSSVNVRCESRNAGNSLVTVRVNRLRAFLWVMYWGWCSGLVAVVMPQPAGVALFIGITCAAWLGIVKFLGSYLIEEEIRDYLSR
jgi:hypothetical protein